MIRRWLHTATLTALLLATAPGRAPAQKTDVVTVRNGDRMVGEMKGLQRGQLQFSTDAMSTVYVEWPKVVTVNTDKSFEIVLSDGTIYFGSLGSGAPDSVVIRTDSTTVDVATQSVVTLQRLKSSFWDALDGNLNLGIDFTQQNAKTDLSWNGEVHYARGANLTKIRFNSTLSRQDGTDDITRLQPVLAHARRIKENWFFLGFLAGDKNTQLSLNYRATIGAGIGRFVVQSNRLDLGLWIAPGFSREEFTGESPGNSFPLILAADVDYFTWGALDTNVSSELSVVPILDEWGRWRVNLNVTASREVLKNFYVNLSVTEAYDSAPTAADANNNDFSFTTSFGWSF